MGHEVTVVAVMTAAGCHLGSRDYAFGDPPANRPDGARLEVDQQDPPAGSQHSLHLTEGGCARPGRHLVQHGGREDQVEGPVGIRHGGGVTGGQGRPLPEAMASHLQHRW
jgi:hypothetical protein